MNIRITKISDDKLSRETWDFYFNSDLSGLCVLKLSNYFYQTRKNTQTRTWINQKVYECNRRGYKDIDPKEVLTPELIQEAKEAVLKKIEKEIRFKD